MCGTVQTKSRKRTLALAEVIAQLEDNKLKSLLSSFACKQDKDIQNFLQDRAVKFEILSKSRTYLIVDQEQIPNPDISSSELTIYGYISLAIKNFTAPEGMSNRQRQQLDGFSAKEHGKIISNFPCYLIGQLARNSNVPKDSLSGKELLAISYSLINEAIKLVGGRNILVECRNNKKLVAFYLDNDFSQVARIPDGNQDMVQLIRRI